MSCTDELGNRCTHKVRLHFRSIGSPRVPELTALRNAQQIYGPSGICLEFASGMSLQLSAEQQADLSTVDGDCKWKPSSDEQRILHGLGAAGVPAREIIVYYVDTIRKTDGSALAGCGGHAPNRMALIVAASGSPWTLGHELGHVLLTSTFRPVHSSGSMNLMFSPTANITANPPSLTAAQQTAIKANPACVSC